MIGSIQASAGAIAGYGKEMASVSERISRAFREDSDVNVETEVTKSILIEHGLKANVSVIRAQDEMLGSVLNLIA